MLPAPAPLEQPVESAPVLDVPQNVAPVSDAPISAPQDTSPAAPGSAVRQDRPQRASGRWRESTLESSSVPPQTVPVVIRKIVLLNATEPGEIRVAILENNELAEIFMERKSHGQQAGNIYKGRVVNVEPSLQAAFVDLGAERNGFLHASDCIPPDGGYADVVSKMPRGTSRDGRNTSNPGRQQPGNHSFNKPVQRTVDAVATVVSSAPTVAAPAVAAPDSQLAASTPEGAPIQSPAVHTAAPVSQAPGASPGVPGQPQPVNGLSGDSKRRRRRRGGRGRSGRGRPVGPAPMLAPGGTAPVAPSASESATGQTVPATEAVASGAPPDSAGQPADPASSDAEAAPTLAAREFAPTESKASPHPVHAENDEPDDDDFDDGDDDSDDNQGDEADFHHDSTGAQKDAASQDSNAAQQNEDDRDDDDAESIAPENIIAPDAPVNAPAPAEQAAVVHAEVVATPPPFVAPVVHARVEVISEISAPVQSPAAEVAEQTAPETSNPLETDERRGIEHDDNFAQEMGVPERPENIDTRPEAEAEAESESESEESEAGSEHESEIDFESECESETDATVAETERAAQETRPTAETPARGNTPVEGASAPVAVGPAAPVHTPREHRGGGGRSGRERPNERRYTVQEMLREGQEVLIQVAKEGIGQKGPALTTYISIPGRYLVLMPAVQRLGVSKRIENEDQRRALKEALAQINPPDDMGVIVRTAGTGRSKDELQRDLNYLLNVWENMKKKARVTKAPNLIYQEGDVVTRVFRDVITDDVTEIYIDDPVVLERAREFIRETSPGNEHKLKLYSDAEPLFHKWGVEQQLQRLFNRKVNLKSGGSIVIEQTEALVAIDVNTGRFREKRTQDDTILQTNLEAAREIARQLRLRDIGGLVMIDFIDMEIHDHRRRVERELKSHLARDKARINVLPVSMLGVVEMTRQRVRHSLRKTLFERCPHCSGSGHIKSPESVGLDLLRELKSQLKDRLVKKVKVLLNSAVAFAILNQFRKDLVRMEEAHGVTIEVCGDPVVSLSQMQVSVAKEGGEWILKKVSEVDDYVRNS